TGGADDRRKGTGVHGGQSHVGRSTGDSSQLDRHAATIHVRQDELGRGGSTVGIEQQRRRC
ncbi:MAG: hypothetical protein ACKO55_09635, partial [Bacteroidota bacterium]